MVCTKKNSLFVGGWDRKTRVGITLCHHSASLVMPIDDPRDGFFNPILTLMMDSCSLSLGNLVMLRSNNCRRSDRLSGLSVA